MATYPYLPDLEACDKLEIEEDALDSGITTPFENGMIQSRARYSRIRRTFSVPFTLAPLEVKQRMSDFVRNTAVGSSGIFIYVDPNTQEEINVRFAKDKLPRYKEVGMGQGVGFDFTLELEEV